MMIKLLQHVRIPGLDLTRGVASALSYGPGMWPVGHEGLWISSLPLLCRLMLGFMFVTAFLSMWISNTATTAMMIPIVEAMLEQMVATNVAVDASQRTMELLDKNKASELPGAPWLRFCSHGLLYCCQMLWLPPLSHSPHAIP